MTRIRPPETARADNPADIDHCRDDRLPAILRRDAGEFPPHVDPMVYRRRHVAQHLRRTALLPHFSMPTPHRPNQPIYERKGLVGVHLHENLHRLRIQVTTGSGEAFINLVAKNQIADVDVEWRPIAEDYHASPDRLPPPICFDPTGPQRFELRSGRFLYSGTGGSGFRAFGSGRVFPTVFGDQPQMRLGAIVHVVRGLGQLAGCPGVLILNGTVEPPDFMDLAITAMFADFDDQLRSTDRDPAIDPLPDPDPGSTFFLFYGDTADRSFPILPIGDLLLLPIRIRMRLARADFEIKHRNIVTYQTFGSAVGRCEANVWTGPWGGFPVPCQSRQDRMIFETAAGEVMGELHADTLEGRIFQLRVPGAPMIALFNAGIGPLQRGRGIFAKADGMVCKIALVSVFPRFASLFYIVRLDDPDGLYRAAAHRAWG